VSRVSSHIWFAIFFSKLMTSYVCAESYFYCYGCDRLRPYPKRWIEQEKA
jgi:hypothetical protein